MRQVSAVFLLFFLLSQPADASAQPQQVASTNLCADQWLMELLPKERILGLSPLAKNPLLSPQAEKAEDLKIVPAKLGIIASMKPDLVMFGSQGHFTLEAGLKRFHIPTYRLKDPASLDEMAKQAEELGALLGAHDRASKIVQRIREIQNLPQPDYKIPVLWWWEGGSSATNQPLMKDALARIGVKVVTPRKGKMNVEDVVLSGAEIVVAPAHYAELPALSSERLSHPALQHGTQPFLVISGSHFTCPTPVMLDGLKQLRNTIHTGGKPHAE